MSNLKNYVVLYRIEKIMSPLDAPFGYFCLAEDADRSEEQCINVEPGADIVWVVEADDYQSALDDYYAMLFDNAVGDCDD